MKLNKITILIGSVALLFLAVIMMTVTYLFTPSKTIIKEIPVTVEKVVTVEKLVPINVFLTGSDINLVIGFFMDNYPDDYEKILAFYDLDTKDRKISKAIVEQSLHYGVPVNLSFGLGKRESGFDQYCVTQNSVSVDRGIYQLNSKSFPTWSRQDFFNIDKNCKYGIAFLKELIDNNDSQELALASYNAGSRKILRQEIPYTTSIHVWTIKRYEKTFDIGFNTRVLPQLGHVTYSEGRIKLEPKTSQE